jgi:trigger factor
LKTNFILARIAEREKIEVTKEDINLRVRQEAVRYNISPEKMRKELEEHDGLDNLAEQILLGKVLDFLKANVSIEKPVETIASEENP